MERREFVKKTAAALCVAPLTDFSNITLKAVEVMPDWLINLVKLNDIGVENLRSFQVKDSESKDFGGLKDNFDILNPHSTAALIQWGACSLSSPRSQFYRSGELLNDMNSAANYLVKTQHSDGTIDLLSTNFHSTPDTGFLVKRLTMAYTLIEKSDTPAKEKMLDNLKSFLIRAGEALSTGGIHTPNHRWVVCAALARLYKLWPDPKYKARAENWLSEHIDMDDDGQFNEKSTFIYSSLSDRLLITIANGFNKPALLDFVRRNLDMTLYYVHPNGEIVTDASGRQDKAIVGTMENYYYPYRYMAIHDQNGIYAGMCNLIEKTAGNKISGFLDYFLTDVSLWRPPPISDKLPVTYVKAFPNSGIVRVRRENWDSTLIAKNPVWFTFMKGDAVLQGMRFASSFFGKGQFQTDALKKTDHGWVLVQRLQGSYFQPISKEKISQDGDWEKMPKSDRRQSEIQILETKIFIKEIEGGMEIEIVTTGTERVPVAWELIFRQGGKFAGLTKLENSVDSWLLKENHGSYTYDKNTIAFGPGIALHKNTALRGALPPVDAPTVYLTGFTPFRHLLRLY
ncbi:hypothetical protein SAMN04487995_2581 [Dyadobacter koreensis]|uniref:Heparinase II/III-like protein n=1 Tax=Dyadobacter koreensis TaxID=408657 RepID=A0A1H6UJW3_9BACT|nr:hypothetical protein [Dyadobacter koreensis]SEI92611.1 hypothetical protein SAMN04487995_2581 [Dyadobacter koreensis]